MQPVTNEEIAYAETILFNQTGVFDDERRNYIKELATCDLQAVPGSGKTTVLLAKLLIIEKRLPFPDDRGVLVISHTNAAMDEIKEKIGKYCPKLFSVPNFVGTIQAFVDRFLAIPYYVQLFGQKPSRIDDEIYQERARKFSNVMLPGIQRIDQNNAKSYLRANDNIGRIRISPGNPQDQITIWYKGSAPTINRPRLRPGVQNWTNAEKQSVLQWIAAYKEKLMRDGYLCFDDAYYLAEKYIGRFPGIIPIIQHRFKFIFVDEMQDMAPHQYELLETIFNTAPHSCYQRIGDKNQAIFASKVTAANHWIDRPQVLQLTGSHRLTPENAAIVERLGLSPMPVRGLRVNADGTAIAIKPHLIVYGDTNIEQVISEFANIIQQHQVAGRIDPSCRHPFKAICWNTQEEVGKIRIKNFYPGFEREHVKPMVNYNSLASYLYQLPAGRSMRSVYKNLLNALLNILRKEGVHRPDGRYYSKSTLQDYLRTNHSLAYSELQRHLFIWSREILLGQETIILQQIRVYLPGFLQLFGSAINNSNGFINTAPAIPAANTGAPPVTSSNIISANGIKVEVATVHATKGQTHTATLYLESYYERNVQQSGNYESQRLAGLILGQARPQNIHTHVEQSMKMAYVGFSRPTHLLCFAVHENRYIERLTGLNPNEWEIVHI